MEAASRAVKAASRAVMAASRAVKAAGGGGSMVVEAAWWWRQHGGRGFTRSARHQSLEVNCAAHWCRTFTIVSELLDIVSEQPFVHSHSHHSHTRQTKRRLWPLLQYIYIHRHHSLAISSSIIYIHSIHKHLLYPQYPQASPISLTRYIH